ncbi:MAG: hypothetical protein JHC61_00310 [Burkholderiaceae bacterium]|nr:hypothetical protein [Burkholderiaceae bacterium]
MYITHNTLYLHVSRQTWRYISRHGASSKLLKESSLIALSLHCLCELVWILRRCAKLSKEDVVLRLRDLLDAVNVVMNRPAVEAGLSIFEAGGDFADGIMAYEVYWLGVN